MANAATIGFMNEQTIDILIGKAKAPRGTTLILRVSDISHWLKDAKADVDKFVPN